MLETDRGEDPRQASSRFVGDHAAAQERPPPDTMAEALEQLPMDALNRISCIAAIEIGEHAETVHAAGILLQIEQEQRIILGRLAADSVEGSNRRLKWPWWQASARVLLARFNRWRIRYLFGWGDSIRIDRRSSP